MLIAYRKICTLQLLHLQLWPAHPQHDIYLAIREMSKQDIWVCVCACVRMIDRDTFSYVSLSFLLQTLHERAKIQRFMRRLTPRRAHHQCPALTRLTHRTRTYILTLALPSSMPKPSYEHTYTMLHDVCPLTDRQCVASAELG